MTKIISSNGPETAEQLLADAAACALVARAGGGEPRIRIEAAGRPFDPESMTHICITVQDQGSDEHAKDHGYCLNATKAEWQVAVAAAAIRSIIATAGSPAAYDLNSLILMELAKVTGNGVLLYGRDTDRAAPGPGFVVCERWAAGGDRDTDTWYGTEKEAQAHLASLGLRYKRTVIGRSIDLTAEGCNTSEAYYRPA